MALTRIRQDLRRLNRGSVRSFGGQVGWSLSARVVAALLQMAVITLLARNLRPSDFAFVSSMNVLLTVVVAMNGFGLNRQIQYRRSRDHHDQQLPELFARRLRYSYGSAGLWLVVTLGGGLLLDVPHLLALSPAAVWLLVEQTTIVWNAISITDGRTQRLMSSYLCRRVPVLVVVAVAGWQDWNIIWAWTTGLAVGSVLAYVQGRRSQESWALTVWPYRRGPRIRTELDFGFWWAMVGGQIRDFDVAAITLVNPVAAGIYALPARFMSPMGLVTQATASVAFPLLARRDSISRRTLALGVLAGSLPTFLMAGALALAAPLLPVLVGDAYAGSVDVMRVICVTTAFWGPSVLLVTFLQSRSSGATASAGAIVLVANLCSVAFATLAAWREGAVAAATATAVIQAVTCLVLAARSARETSG
jgi:O-antigen/teichoic acid export membrane protein